MGKLPSHASVLTHPELWLESDALVQLGRVAASPGCCRAVGMPDLHPGRGYPIGAVFDFEGVVAPSLIGGDAGCGVTLVTLSRCKPRGDALERRVLDHTEGPVLPHLERDRLLRAAWTAGPRGLLSLDIPDGLASLAMQFPEVEPVSPPVPAGRWGTQLGTIGGGNHFLELSRVTALSDETSGTSFGLKLERPVIVAHSGSRGLGQALLRQWGGQRLFETEARLHYLAQLEAACRYAQTNRLLLIWRMLESTANTRPDRVLGLLDLTHNTVTHVADRYRHRKGAAPAASGQLTVVLGSREAPSHVMLGQGAEVSLSSVAHGAGRKMSRDEARQKLTPRYRRAQLKRTRTGGRVLCDDSRLLYAEHPDAYKPMEPVIRALVDSGAATPVAELTPVVNVKR